MRKRWWKCLKQRGYDVVSNGTENHLFLVSFIKQGLTGKAADAALGKANITVNKNSVPNDPQKPFVTSGIRVGTPAVTRRGFNEQDCRELAGWMCDVLDALGKENEEQSDCSNQRKSIGNLQNVFRFTQANFLIVVKRNGDINKGCCRFLFQFFYSPLRDREANRLIL